MFLNKQSVFNRMPTYVHPTFAVNFTAKYAKIFFAVPAVDFIKFAKLYVIDLI
jgi:hypothetical protein